MEVAAREMDSRWADGQRAIDAQVSGPHGLAEYARERFRSPATLRRWARVVRAYPPADRHPGLSFSHHEAVASHPDRAQLLEDAAREGWSVAQLRRASDLVPKSLRPEAVRELGPQTLDDAIDYCQ